MQKANLLASIRVGRFSNGTFSEESSYKFEGKEVMTVADLFLPDNPLFILTAGECHSLRISLMHDGVAQAPIKRVLSVRALPANGSAMTLKTRDGLVDSTKCEAIALLPPIEMADVTSAETSSASRCLFGGHMMTFQLVITVGMSAHQEHVHEINQKLHCRIVPPGVSLETKAFVRKYGYGWERVPHWKAVGVKASIALANITFNIK